MKTWKIELQHYIGNLCDKGIPDKEIIQQLEHIIKLLKDE